MKELLSTIPPGGGEGRSLLDDIHVLEASRLATLGTGRTRFLQCEKELVQRILSSH